MREKIIPLATISAIALLAFVAFFLTSPKSIDELKRSVAPTASLYPEAKAVSDVLNFVDDSSNAVHLSEVSDSKWVLMYFGYASCPDVCPIDLGKISQTLHVMERKDDLQVVFISVDPARDVGKLSAFAKGFNGGFVGLSAHEEDLAVISKTLGVYHQVVATQKLAKEHANSDSHDDHEMDSHDDHEMDSHDDNYLVDHTTSYLLLNPELALNAILSSPHEPSAMAKALDEIITTLR